MGDRAGARIHHSPFRAHHSPSVCRTLRVHL